MYTLTPIFLDTQDRDSYTSPIKKILINPASIGRMTDGLTRNKTLNEILRTSY